MDGEKLTYQLMVNFSSCSSTKSSDAHGGILCNIFLTLSLVFYLSCIFLVYYFTFFFCTFLVYMYIISATSFILGFIYICVVDVVFGEMFVM
jgi:hypothetical protein